MGACWSGRLWKSCATPGPRFRRARCWKSQAQGGTDSLELSVDNERRAALRPRCGFHTGDAATIGWASKIGGWSITDAGIEALETYPDADELWAELNRRYREVDQRRKQALQTLSDVQQFIATTLQHVDAGFLDRP